MLLIFTTLKMTNSVSVAGIIVNVILLLIIIVLVIMGVMYNNNLHHCETQPSTFCYTIHCPCDGDAPPAPCFGYAKRSAGSGKWYCSNAPLTIVDDQGKAVS